MELFLKMMLGGVILSTIGQDRNNQMFPISWVVVLGETEATWRLFLTKLFADLGIIDGMGWTFISDQ